MLKRATFSLVLLVMGVILPTTTFAQGGCIYGGDSGIPRGCPVGTTGTWGHVGVDPVVAAQRRAENQAHYDAEIAKDIDLRGQGEQAAANGNWQGAVSALQAALDFDRRARYARFSTRNLEASLFNAKANYANSQGDPETAVALFEQGLKFRDDPSIRDWIKKAKAILAQQRAAAANAAARDRLVGEIPAQLADIHARLQPALDKAVARLASARASAEHRLEAMGSAANADLQHELAAHPMRGVTPVPAAASTELASIAQSGETALDAPVPDRANRTADPCAVGREGCLETGSVHAREGFDTPGGAAEALNIPHPASQHPLYADAIQRELDQRGIHDGRMQGLVAAYRNAELNVQNTAAAINAYQGQIDGGGVGAAMATIYQQGLKDKLAGYAADANKAKTDVAAALLDFSVPLPPDVPPEPSLAKSAGGQPANPEARP